MEFVTVVLLFLVLQSFGQCVKPSGAQRERATQYFNEITSEWHGKLQLDISEKVLHLQAIAATATSATASNTSRHLSQVKTNPNDTKALVAFYTSTNGQTWNNNSGWMKGDPCNDLWYGIYCLSGHVLQINLVSNNLTGVLPAGLAGASMLQVLRLYTNRLTGPIPAKILQMKSLQILDLNSNLLTGPFPASISMPNLTQLLLYQNAITGSFPDLSEMPQIQSLEISTNVFTGAFPDLSRSTNLQVVVASRNNFSGEYPNSLGGLRSLMRLWLFNNLFDQPKIPDSWSGLMSLQDIQLDNVYGIIPSYIGQYWTKLMHLVIIDGALEGGFDTGLCDLQLLEDLRLFVNKLSGSLPTCICNLRNVQTFEVSDNQLTGSIPYCLGSLSELTSFYVSRNNISGSLPVSMGSLAKLEIMDVSSNSITGTVPSSFAGLTEIVGFSLCYNKLFMLEEGLEPLYDRIKGYSCELYDNPWSCPLPSNVPASCQATCSKCNTGSRHTQCSACVGDRDCGWCNEGPNCLEGSSSGPYGYKCKSGDWSYGSNAC